MRNEKYHSEESREQRIVLVFRTERNAIQINSPTRTVCCTFGLDHTVTSNDGAPDSTPTAKEKRWSAPGPTGKFGLAALQLRWVGSVIGRLKRLRQLGMMSG